MGAIERQRDELAGRLREALIERRRADAAAGRHPSRDLTEAVEDLVEHEAAILPIREREEIVARILRDTVGLGPLEELLADPEVEEVMVNGADRVYVERRGRIEPTDVHFADEAELRNSIER